MLANKMNAMANRDPLTGIANRRHFDQACKRAIAQGTTQDVPLTVILLDVDFFKRYNDRYGHQAGDECLILVAECLEESVREPGDLVARYGGEEFVVLLQETTLAGGQEVAERIRATLAARALPHEDSDVAPYLTLSQGIAQWRTGESLVMLLERVDGALYQAKEEGRNGYRFAP
ncbi:diguanylate cyclase [Aeromonas caviae]|uniref:diguanylate cyclase n=2 Tax=Aeromonadaceae TaxID=84642 RepID=UPI0038D14DA2